MLSYDTDNNFPAFKLSAITNAFARARASSTATDKHLSSAGFIVSELVNIRRFSVNTSSLPANLFNTVSINSGLDAETSIAMRVSMPRFSDFCNS